MSDYEYERGYETPYKKGAMFNLKTVDGFREVLDKTHNNEAFSSGNPEQLLCRAKYLNPKIGFNLLKYFLAINSPFDYGTSNKKTAEVYKKYLLKKYKQGYRTIIYTEDKAKYISSFKKAAANVKIKHPNFNYHIYHILRNKKGIKRKNGYFEIGNLWDLLKNEKKLNNII